MSWAKKGRPSDGLPAFVDVGTGVPVVALHGGLSTGVDTFRIVGPELAARYRFIAPDLAGHGGSPADIDSLTHDVMADQVESMLTYLHLSEKPLHMLGFSLGAAVAMVLALRKPDRLASLTLVAANTVPTPVTRRGAAEIQPQEIQRDRPRLAAALERLHGARWPELADRLSLLWHEGPLIAPTQLEAISSLLLIVGDRDPWIEHSQQHTILDACPRARLLVIPDADHFVLGAPRHARYTLPAVCSMIDDHATELGVDSPAPRLGA
jgi:pimeloyl-ACP methyl ester carboxylesterase